jgi:hypothetical protein
VGTPLSAIGCASALRECESLQIGWHLLVVSNYCAQRFLHSHGGTGSRSTHSQRSGSTPTLPQHSAATAGKPASVRRPRQTFNPVPTFERAGKASESYDVLSVRATAREGSVVGRSFRRRNWRWRLCAHCPQVFVLRAHRNAVANRGSNLLAVTAGPFLVVVGVSEDYLNVLLGHDFDDSAVLPIHERKSQNPARASVCVSDG